MAGDSQRESGRFARIDSCKSIRRRNYFHNVFERFARIASSLRFANFSAPKRDLQKRGSVREP